ncbi:MAG: hypothetical protein HOY78_19785 [Saccharothrix sp.]|nr:hypothetical protein [Saccharothrix sp.]
MRPRVQWHQLATMPLAVVSNVAAIVVASGLSALVLSANLFDWPATWIPFQDLGILTVVWPVIALRRYFMGLYISDHGLRNRSFWRTTTFAWHEISHVEVHPIGLMNPGHVLWIVPHHGEPLETSLFSQLLHQRGVNLSDVDLHAAWNEVQRALAWSRGF